MIIVCPIHPYNLVLSSVNNVNVSLVDCNFCIDIHCIVGFLL